MHHFLDEHSDKHQHTPDADCFSHPAFVQEPDDHGDQRQKHLEEIPYSVLPEHQMNQLLSFQSSVPGDRYDFQK